MAAAAILKNRIIAISRLWFERFLRNMAHWCTYHNLPWYWYSYRGRVRLGRKGRFWCAACKSVYRTCSTSTLFGIGYLRGTGQASAVIESASLVICHILNTVTIKKFKESRSEINKHSHAQQKHGSFTFTNHNILTLSRSAQLLVVLSEFSNQLRSHQFNLGIRRQKVTAAAFIQNHVWC